MRVFATTTVLIAITLLISACNTMQGMGQDMQVGGKKLERSADDNKGSDSRNY